MDELSLSDVKCLDYAIDLCKDKSFPELTDFSHGLAWSNTRQITFLLLRLLLCQPMLLIIFCVADFYTENSPFSLLSIVCPYGLDNVS